MPKVSIWMNDKEHQQIMKEKSEFEERTGCRVSLSAWITSRVLKPKEVSA